jgi:protein kinase-like protein
VIEADSLLQLLERYVQAVESGERPDPEALCGGRADLLEPLLAHIREYEAIERAFEASGRAAAGEEQRRPGPEGLPSFEGFRTVERLGSGGMGEVYKLVDLKLGRTVAAKVLRRDSALSAVAGNFLREARALALFQDSRIVQIHELWSDRDPPVLLMEYVDGFQLDRVGPSLSHAQRAEIVAEVADALQGAHELGLQHRDLKPANILLDTRLRPKILDFGLSGGDPRRGHGVGTLEYAAPEQLDPGRDIDARTDVYALGVILYELLCGRRPYAGRTEEELIGVIHEAQPALPVELDPGVPEPLQAIALKAMDRDPARRYASARDLAADLRRYLDGRPVLARPAIYASALGRRIQPHLEQIREWVGLKLIYPHEAQALHESYARLEAREDDWIVENRHLSFTQISLYLGAFLLLCGGLFYFAAHRLFEGIQGLSSPVLALGVPFAALNGAALLLDRRERRAAAIALYLGAAVLLLPFLLILFHECGLWLASEGQFFDGGAVSNRQLQVAAVVTCAWMLGLALRTRTEGLSSVFTGMALLAALAGMTDLGLRSWLEEGRWDLLAAHLAPVLLLYAGLGAAMERSGRPWLATPLYVGGALLLVVVLELSCLHGRAFHHLGLSLAAFQPGKVSDPELLDTLAAMAVAGVLVYGAAWVLDRYGSALARKPAHLLFAVSPFAVLEPIGYLNQVGEYAPGYLWAYVGLALGTAFLSRFRQRKSFYYAGLGNTGVALVLIADRYEWLDAAGWATAVLLGGLAFLGLGVSLDRSAHTRRAERR